MEKKIKSGMIGKLWVTVHQDMKLEGISSISTSCKSNPYCKKRAERGIGSCAKCYSQKQLLYKTGLLHHLEDNFKILENPMEDKDIYNIKLETEFCRGESFGDAMNHIHPMNMVRIFYNNPNVKFGNWSHNPFLWKEAYSIYGKPNNCTHIHSSSLLGKRDPQKYLDKFDFIDADFTVYRTLEEVNKAVENGFHRCNGIKCNHVCEFCYRGIAKELHETTGEIQHIAELLRK